MKKAKTPPTVFDFRIKFTTRDGSVVMDRGGDPHCWISPNRQLDKEFAAYSLPKDASEHGVRVLSYTLDPIKGIHAIVEWL